MTREQVCIFKNNFQINKSSGAREIPQIEKSTTQNSRDITEKNSFLAVSCPFRCTLRNIKSFKAQNGENFQQNDKEVNKLKIFLLTYSH